MSETRQRAYRVRLYPKPAQACTLNRVFGARRVVWNWALRLYNERYRAGNPIDSKEVSRAFTQLRRAEQTSWLQQLPYEPFSQTLRDLMAARRNFFAHRARLPRRKTYGTVDSARFTIDQRRADRMVDREGGRLTLPAIGTLRFRVTEPLAGRLRSVTVSRDGAGRWYASLTADRVPTPSVVAPTRAVLGIDLGLKSKAVFSDGTDYAAQRLLRKYHRRRRYQRHYARQQAAALCRMGLDPRKKIPKGTRVVKSHRMVVTQRRINCLTARMTDARRDYTHLISRRAVDRAQVVCIEDLAVKAMGRTMRHGFRRAVANAAMSEARRQIEYKATWAGRDVSIVGRFYPSSKTCGHCGSINRGLTLRERRWTCADCGTELDRDLNAATNIEREGLRLLALNRTPRSGGTDAREEHACAAGNSPPAGQPNSLNREPDYRTAQPCHPDERSLLRETG